MKARSMRISGRNRSIEIAWPSLLLFSSLFVLPLLLVSFATPTLAQQSTAPPSGEQGKSSSTSSKSSPVDSCFCKIDTGILEDCPCNTKSIDDFNKNSIHQKVMDVLSRHYFRYFQVNFDKPCKFWDGDGQCGSRNCAVDTCHPSDVPEHVINLSDNINNNNNDKEQQEEAKPEEKPSSAYTLYGYFMEKVHEFVPLFEPLVVMWTKFSKDYLPATAEPFSPDCQEEPSYSRVDTALPPASVQLLNEFCTLDPLEAGDTCDYIDLLKNEEKFTGYAGHSANRIWGKIYGDLCFKSQNGGMEDLCLEEKTFFRIVSGLHTSITVHLCKNYLLQEENPMMGKKAIWGPNIPEFRRRFDPVLTGGQGPDWLRNVYYLYLVELRAIAKAGPLLSTTNYGDPETSRLVSEISESVALLPESFDETKLFKGDGFNHLQQFKEKFREISQLMDCMGCERCKVWGKLQVTGVGTALKILVTPVEQLRLTRHEIVALLNGFGRVSTSIKELDTFRI